MGIPTPFDPLASGGGGHSWDDFIAYVSLSKYSNTAETGQELSYYNVSESNFTTYANIPCVNMTESSPQSVSLVEPTINQGTSLPRSYSGWLVMTDCYPANMRGIAIGSFNSSKELCSPNNPGFSYEIQAGGHSQDFSTGVYVSQGSWHHYVQQVTGDGTLELWLDGVKIYSGENFEVDINSTTLMIGMPLDYTYDNYLVGYAAAVRLWNRALTEAEIVDLSHEFTPRYQIIASDLSFSLYQQYESYSIYYSSVITPVTFEIIEGELPSTISFNTSTGEFYGKGLTDEDHVYNLKVRITAQDSDPAEVNVTIYTYKTARIEFYDQTLSFISNKAEAKSISYTSDESVTFTIESGTLPARMSMSSGGYFSSNGTNTSAETQQVVVRATSANNQTGVTATMTLDMQMNAVVLNAQTLKFYTAQGEKTKAVKYSGSLNTVSDAVFSMTGTLPVGVTWDATTGSFTSDGTQSADETVSVSVTVSSANGTSTAATATMTLEVSTEDIVDPIIEDGLTLFIPCEKDWSAQQGVSLNSVGTEEPTSTTNDGKKCIYFNGNTILANQDDSYWNLNGDRGEAITMCFWFKPDLTNITGDETFICQIGNDNGYSDGGCAVYKRSDTNIIQQMEFGHWTNDILTNDLSSWHFYAMQFNGSNGGLDTYVDGVKKGGQSRGWPICKSRTVTIGKFLNTYNPLAFNDDHRTNEGWYTRIRLYNRLLTNSEIQDLAAEFTPTP